MEVVKVEPCDRCRSLGTIEIRVEIPCDDCGAIGFRDFVSKALGKPEPLGMHSWEKAQRTIDQMSKMIEELAHRYQGRYVKVELIDPNDSFKNTYDQKYKVLKERYNNNINYTIDKKEWLKW